MRARDEIERLKLNPSPRGLGRKTPRDIHIRGERGEGGERGGGREREEINKAASHAAVSDARLSKKSGENDANIPLEALALSLPVALKRARERKRESL